MRLELTQKQGALNYLYINMSNLKFAANIVLIVGIVLLGLQVVLISQLDKTNFAINNIDKSLSKLSEQYVTYDNYVTVYKSPIVINMRNVHPNNKVIYMSVKSDIYMSYDFATHSQ